MPLRWTKPFDYWRSGPHAINAHRWTDAQRARVWESGLHAAQTAKAVVTSMYEAAGTSTLYIDCPIERAHRHIYAVMQHVVFASMWLEAGASAPGEG